MKLKEFFPQIIQENKPNLVAKAIDQAIAGVDESLSYKDFAVAVAIVLKEEYGAHLFDDWMEILHAELGKIRTYKNKSISENEDLSSLDSFLKYFKSYDPYYEYIDDGGQYRRASDRNDRIIAMFKALSPEDKKVAFKATQDYFESDRGKNAFKL